MEKTTIDLHKKLEQQQLMECLCVTEADLTNPEKEKEILEKMYCLAIISTGEIEVISKIINNFISIRELLDFRNDDVKKMAALLNRDDVKKMAEILKQAGIKL